MGTHTQHAHANGQGYSMFMSTHPHTHTHTCERGTYGGGNNDEVGGEKGGKDGRGKG